MRLIAVECWSAMLKTDSSWKRHQMSWSIDQKWVHHALGHEFWWGQRSWTQIWDLDGSSWKIAGTSSTLQFFMLVEMILSWYMLDLDIFHASWCDFWADSYWTWSFFMLVRWFWVWHRDCDRNFRDFHIWYRSIAGIAMIILIPYVKKWFWTLSWRKFERFAMEMLKNMVELAWNWVIFDGTVMNLSRSSWILSDFRWNCDEFE